MDDNDKILLLFAGTLVAVIIGLVVYSIAKKNAVAVQPAVPITLTGESQGSIVNPTGYYQDAPQTQPDPLPYTPIVQNEENIKWTDWLGRERVISISRMVH